MFINTPIKKQSIEYAIQATSADKNGMADFQLCINI